ncbi:hypothetical protein ANCDUO_01663 [Ancylostoma duodenale]|uniref:WD domain, G-beta repeat protein n=1 Tax=Ancylostoma duodenale TaxID=51022 RepID=A0A0C2H8N6_9BILA|nr:hypothetical protein ANCDUO_01663 [Ancylostoma duodenale]
MIAGSPKTSQCQIGYNLHTLRTRDFSGITMISRSPSKNRLVVGRDNGSIRLYSCPVQSITAGFHALTGHTHAISAVTFVGSDLITAAVADGSLFQWQL